MRMVLFDPPLTTSYHVPRILRGVPDCVKTENAIRTRDYAVDGGQQWGVPGGAPPDDGDVW